MAKFVGGENAGRPAGFIFYLEDGKVRSKVYSPRGEATALRDIGMHDEVEQIARGANVWQKIAEEFHT